MTDERQKWKQRKFAEHYGIVLTPADLSAKLSFVVYEEIVLPDLETLRRMAASVKRAEINTKETKEVTEEKQPVFDSVGVEVRGDVKVVYNAKGLSKTHGSRGESWFTTRTECGRDVVNILHPSGTYEVAIFLNGELERGYRGKEGSDAHRVYEGTLRFWAMKEARTMLFPTIAQVEDMRFVELCVSDGEHCLPSEAVPTDRRTEGR